MFLGLVLVATLGLTGHAQTNNQNVRALSLKEALNLALAHNLDIQIERLSPQIVGYYLSAAYGAYDPTLDFTAKRTFVDQPAQFNPKKWPPPAQAVELPGVNSIRVDSEYELTVDSIGPGLNGRLPLGLSYNLFARADRFSAKTYASPVDVANIQSSQFLVDIFGLPYLTRPGFTNDNRATVGVSLKQPLLKDFWIEQYRRNIQIQKSNLKISDLAFRGQVMSNLTLVTTAYYDLVFAREQVTVETTALELARRFLDDTRRKVQAGTLTALAQQQAESDVEILQTALFAAQQNYTQQENRLKNLLTDNLQSWMTTSIVPTENLTNVTELPPNRSVSWINALERRPDILEMRAALEKMDIVIRYNYNQLFPSMDLIGSYGLQSVRDGFSSTWEEVGRGGNAYYSVGVVFSFPLGNVTARNDYKASQLAKKQALLRYQDRQQRVMTEVDTAVKLAETTFKQISSTRKAREFAEEALNSATKEFEAGARTSFFVLESQRNLIRARSAEIRALADYNIALANLALSEGTTLERNQINLKSK